MISLSAARALIAKNVRPLTAQAIPLSEAFGRVLREDVSASEDLPAFNRSAVDGYAMGPDGDSPRFAVIGEIQPGVIPRFQVKRGECARIFTGACVPDGATRVLMQENALREETFIVPTGNNPATHIRRRGDDARKGDLLLKRGTRLGAGELSLLASLGICIPKTSPQVRVAHFVTGNELIEPSQIPQPGEIRDSNSTLVANLISQFGGEIVKQQRLVDDFELMLKKARESEGSFDLLLVSGGASVGDYDFGKKLLLALGFEIHFEKISLRPGKPLVFATRGNQAAFILPGNPVSHFVTLHAAVRLALEAFTSNVTSWKLTGMALADKFDYTPDARETFWPARVTIQNNTLIAQALRWQSSGDVTGLAGVNALLQIASNAVPPEAGDCVNVLLLELP